MVLVAQALNPTACWEFEGEILVLHHPTTISTRYQAMVHCGSIRQTASILSMSQDCLRTGDKAGVHFRFMKHPEYLIVGQRLVRKTLQRSTMDFIFLRCAVKVIFPTLSCMISRYSERVEQRPWATLPN